MSSKMSTPLHNRPQPNMKSRTTLFAASRSDAAAEGQTGMCLHTTLAPSLLRRDIRR